MLPPVDLLLAHGPEVPDLSSIKDEPERATGNLHPLIGEKPQNLLEKIADKVIAKN